MTARKTNRALDLLGFEQGDQERVSPNDHVNKSQSTNNAERTVGKAALHNEELGFLGASELAQKSNDTGKSIDEVRAEDKK